MDLPQSGSRSRMGLALVGLVMGTAFLATSFAGGGLGRDYQILGAVAGTLMLVCSAVFIAAVASSNRTTVSAATLPLPQEAPEELYQLGRPTAMFRSQNAAGSMVLIGIGLLFCCGGGVGITALTEGQGNPQMTKVAVVLPFAGILALFAGIRNLYSAHRVLVFPEGLAVLQGSAVTVWRWDDVESVRRNLTEVHQRRTSPRTCTLRRQDGQMLEFNSTQLEKTDQLGDLAEREVGRRLLPRARATLQQGGAVDFGPLSVDQFGLHQGARTIAWHEVVGVCTGEGQLTVTKAGQWRNWCSIPVSTLPNMPVLVSLLQEHVRVVS
jgi:hypothetical protein